MSPPSSRASSMTSRTASSANMTSVYLDTVAPLSPRNALGPRTPEESFEAPGGNPPSRPRSGLGDYTRSSSGRIKPDPSRSVVKEPEQSPFAEPLPWSAEALAAFRARMRGRGFTLLEKDDTPTSARLDGVFCMPPELWPVLPPGALYCLEGGDDPRVSHRFLHHSDYPETKVRVGTYFGKWSPYVDYVVAWQPPPPSTAWTLGGAPPPDMPWEPRQVVAHTTRGEYQYSRTRHPFRPSAKHPLPLDAEGRPTTWCDAHGVDHSDTKAANGSSRRNSDRDREAHLVDPPKPNTWGEHARRSLIGRLRGGGGGAYVHHVMYDHSAARTSCGRRVPSGYLFTLAPAAAAVKGGPRRAPSPGRPASASASRAPPGRSASTGPASAAARRPLSASLAASPSAASAAAPLAWQRSSTSARFGAGALLPGPLRSHSMLGWTPPGMAAPGRPSHYLAAPARWRTYGVPFSHPIHRTRAVEMEAAVAAGPGGKAECGTDAVVAVAEEALRLARPTLFSPLVLESWAQVPALYGKHMAAALKLMAAMEGDEDPVQMHLMLHHLQHAATLEYDRLDAKLALLPLMARLGRKSAEVDAWLQVTVAHATYLYGSLAISDPDRWQQPARQQPPLRAAASLPLAAPAPSAPPLPLAASISLPAAAAPLPDPAAPAAEPSSGAAAPLPPKTPSALALGGGASLASLSGRAPLASLVAVEEWAAVVRLMDACRHSAEYDQWVLLRPVMLRGPQRPLEPEASAPRPEDSFVTTNSWGLPTASLSTVARAQATPPDPFLGGPVNGDLLQYLTQDMTTMNSEGFVPPPPPAEDFPPPRGHHGAEPPPLTLAAVRFAQRVLSRRYRWMESPLPAAVAATDVFHMRSKVAQYDPSGGSPGDPARPPDPGAVAVSQAATIRATVAREAIATRQASIRRAMRGANGLAAEPTERAVAAQDAAHAAARRFKREVARRAAEAAGLAGAGGAETASIASEASGLSDMTGISPATSRSGSPPASRSGSSLAAGSRRSTRGLPTVAKRGGGLRLETGSGVGSGREPEELGAGTQTTPRLTEPPPLEDEASIFARSVAEEEAVEKRQLLLSGRDGKTRGELMREALLAEEDSKWRLQPVGDGTVPAPRPGSPAGSGAHIWKQLSTGRGIGDYSAADKAADEELAAAAERAAQEAGGGLAGEDDFDTAVARRRAVNTADEARGSGRFVPRGEALKLLMSFLHLAARPDMVEALRRSVSAPIARPIAGGKAEGGGESAEEMQQQRIRAVAWHLGVNWRRISTDTYTAFLSRIMGWPPALVLGMPRTRCTALIAEALVAGFEPAAAPQLPGRQDGVAAEPSRSALRR